uniref:Uncharacterized protein AlNc14C14G1607 n=1 Tax=Albugo laibachii Nc14 TaxID=890382 RepID=F0W3U2_9STRA|nr:conserved hypothetical protein [Albugo laibachii Nc14]|eukprot:CCA15690.1 conserved hypothetical protein [Albugo laibachii Nc14]
MTIWASARVVSTDFIAMKPLFCFSLWPIFALVLTTIVRYHKTEAMPEFVNRIPNGDHILGTRAAGHENGEGGGPLNPFGKDFRDGGLKWTKRLCELDSDHDGATNGEELGDPCCSGISGKALRRQNFQPTHPGKRNKWNLSTLSDLRCSKMGDQNYTLEVPLKKEDSASSQDSSGSTIYDIEPEKPIFPKAQQGEASIEGNNVQAASNSCDPTFTLTAFWTFLTISYWMILSI